MKLKRSQIIVISKMNARTNLTGIDELAGSIKRHGLLENLIVQIDASVKQATDGTVKPHHILVGGFRRIAAIDLLCKEDPKWADVEWECGTPIAQDLDYRLVNLIENIQREGITSYDYAVGLVRLRESGMTTQAISNHLKNGQKSVNGTSVSNINNLMRLQDKLKPSLLEHWKAEHPAAGVHNWLQVLGKDNDYVKQEAMWKALTSEETDDGSVEHEYAAGEEKPTRDSAVKRKTTAIIAKMIEALSSHGGVDKDKAKVAISALKWSLDSEKKSLLGVSLE